MAVWFAYPWALLAGLAVPVVIGVYLLRARPQQHIVPSLLVWRMVVRTQLSGTRPVLQRIPWIALLESAIILLLTLAAAGVRVPRIRATAAHVLVLDDSASMRAPGLRGASARDAALDACEQLLRCEHNVRCMAVLAARAPRMLPNLPRSRAALERVWQCRAPAAALDDAVTLALRLAGSNALVHVFTDAMPSNYAPGRVAWHAFGTPADNAAFVFAGRARGGTNDVCAVDVANFSARAAEVRVAVRIGMNDVVAQQVVPLAPGATSRLVLHIPRNQSVRFELPADALPDDNVVTLLPDPPRDVRVQLDVAGPARAYIERALRASGMVRLVTSAPHLLITEAAPPDAHAECWIVRLHTAPRGTALAGPFLVASAHPVCEGLALQHAVWSAATNQLPGFPLIAAGAWPLLTMENSAGAPQLHLQWLPAFSTLQTMPAWPVLWHNIVRWRRAELPGVALPNARLGDIVQARLPRGAAATVRDADGAALPATRIGDTLAIEPERIGMYRLDAGALQEQFAVHFLAPAESDLRSRAAGAFGAAETARMQQMEFLSYAWLCGVAALALLIVHQWWLARAGGAPE